MNDFTPNVLGFDSAGCMAQIKSIYDMYLNDLSAQLVALVQRAVFKDGNGSKFMRLTAMTEVKETKREISDNEITLEAGIDLSSIGNDSIRVRVAVVLHGNQAGGTLMTKPGQATWRKDVKYQAMSKAASVYPLPAGFNQSDAEDDIVEYISKNIEEDLGKHVDDYLDNVARAAKAMDWSVFITGG